MVYFEFGAAGVPVGPNNSYITSRGAAASQPLYCLWANQLNATYTPLFNVTNTTAVTIQPNVSTFAGDPTANGTMFVALTSEDVYITLAISPCSVVIEGARS